MVRVPKMRCGVASLAPLDEAAAAWAVVDDAVDAVDSVGAVDAVDAVSVAAVAVAGAGAGAGAAWTILAAAETSLGSI